MKVNCDKGILMVSQSGENLLPRVCFKAIGFFFFRDLQSIFIFSFYF